MQCESIVKICVGDKLKQIRPGYHLRELEYPTYPSNKNLCPVFTAQEYLSRTKHLRVRLQFFFFFISFVRPYKPVSKSTVSRWAKTTLGLAGVDLTRFKSHSIRAASTSATSRISVSLGTILRTAGWPKKHCTFDQYYPKEVHKQGDYSARILNTSLSAL